MSQQTTLENERDVIISPSCLEVFPAKMSATQDCEPVLMVADPIWFLNKSDYSETSNHIGQYLRMSQDFAEGGLKRCLEKLPKSGMMRNGILYELPDLVPHIRERGCSLLPTVTTQEIEHLNANLTTSGIRRKTMDGKDSHSLNLADRIRLLPTPTCRDYKGATIKRILEGNPKRALDCEMQVHGLKLQPAFAEWMMGFPEGWTALDASEMPSSRSKCTQSSKQSRKLKGGGTPPRSRRQGEEGDNRQQQGTTAGGR